MTITNFETFRKAVRYGTVEGIPIHSAYLYKDNMTEQDRYSIFLKPDYDDMYVTPYASDIVCMRYDGITLEGEEFLAGCIDIT